MCLRRAPDPVRPGQPKTNPVETAAHNHEPARRIASGDPGEPATLRVNVHRGKKRRRVVPIRAKSEPVPAVAPTLSAHAPVADRVPISTNVGWEVAARGITTRPIPTTSPAAEAESATTKRPVHPTVGPSLTNVGWEDVARGIMTPRIPIISRAEAVESATIRPRANPTRERHTTNVD